MKPDPESEEPPRNAYGKYASLAFQMLATIFLFTWGGSKLDERSGNNTPVWTLILSLTSIGASLYLFIRGARK